MSDPHPLQTYGSFSLAEYYNSLTLSQIYLCNFISEINGSTRISDGKPAAQSSVEDNRVADYAVDGDYGTYSMTKRNEPPQWWMVDLEDDYFIDRMYINAPPVTSGKQKERRINNFLLMQYPTLIATTSKELQ